MPEVGEPIASTIGYKKLLRRNRNIILIGVLLQYFGLLWLFLGNMNIIPMNALYNAGAFIEIADSVVILIYTYKLLKTLGSGVLKRLIVAIINVFIGINVIVTIALVAQANKALKADIA